MKRVDDNQFLTGLRDAWSSALDAILLTPKTVEELVALYSERTDAFIAKAEVAERLKFVAGEFLMTARSPEDITARADLYFQDAQGSWVKKELKSTVRQQHLAEKALQQLLVAGTEKFRIAHPSARSGDK